jgi:transcriptional regulator with XRE-family HTH domain
MLGGDLVREARRRAGLTQVELAAKAETTQSAIARLESGRVDPGFSQVLRLLELCGFRLDVALDPYDDSDLAQARRVLDTPFDDRLERLAATVEQLHSFRADFEAGRAS